MTDLDAIFRAGSVRRWPANPDLCDTIDRVDAHSGRVARWLVALHPDPSILLLKAALIHDDGEIAVGDVKAPAKDADPAFAAALARREDHHRWCLWGATADVHLLEEERRWLHFCDRLDAYLWAQRHAPHALSDDGWPEARAWLIEEGAALGALPKMLEQALRRPAVERKAQS